MLQPPPEVVRAVLTDAHRRTPEEACGIVLETAEGLSAVAAPNASPTPTVAFELPLPWLLPRLRGAQLRAIYHSHPDGPPTLSATDRARFRGPDGPLWPGVELWVVGLRRGVVDLGRHVWDSSRLDFRRLPPEAP